MNILGYDVTEWLAVVSICVMLISFLVWLVREVIVKPNAEQNQVLTNSIKNLSSKLEDFSKETKESRELLNRRLDEHDRRLDRHHERIKNLYEDKK